MLIDIHCMGPRQKYSLRQGSFARLRPRRFEKELRNDGVSGISAQQRCGSFVESGIRDSQTGCRRCFTALKWKIRSHTDIEACVSLGRWNGAG